MEKKPELKESAAGAPDTPPAVGRDAISSRQMAAKVKTPFYKPRHINTEIFFEKTREIFELSWFTNAGPKVIELENEIAKAHGVAHCIAVCNATIGLQMLLSGLDITGEVITTPFTFVATAHAIKWEQLSPVFCDIDPDTLTLDPARIRENITPKTSAILGVHVFGQPCDVDAIREIGEEFGLKVIYDAAHCFMTSYNGEKVGGFGEAEVLSFHATKIFQTFEGGAILTNNGKLAAKLRLLKNFGFMGMDRVEHLGINAKMNEVSAAYGLSLLPYMPETIARCKSVQLKYRALLSGLKGVTFFETGPDVNNNGQYVVTFIDSADFGLSRDQLWAYLWSKGVETRRYFYPGVHMCEPYRSHTPWFKSLLGVTNKTCSRVLCLPSYFDITDEDMESVSSLIREASDKRDEISRWYAEFSRSGHWLFAARKA